MAGKDYASMVPEGEQDDATIPLGDTPEPDGDGDGDDPVTSLGDFCPGVMGGAAR